MNNEKKVYLYPVVKIIEGDILFKRVNSSRYCFLGRENSKLIKVGFYVTKEVKNQDNTLLEPTRREEEQIYSKLTYSIYDR